ncbi:DUF3888 domain-containing protein [Bacillus cereus]|uniref:DUF3888 domain-containing protein n=1 Tax=Bacillus cereus TaxID=1396 RepID=A0AA44TED4_BACCE|nr:DUF3888 domain-containing protein [Bacillus cereus]PFN04672.1 hypothetical protein COJ55_20800 [Bacillus cereus]PFR96687.1 hypothetical protein COK38_20655 [Bacillus cereus]
MNKISVLIFCLFLMITTTTYASIPTKTQATKENLLEDAVIDLLQPQMYEAVQKHYGTTYDKGFQCLRVIDIKKLDHPGSWLFKVTLEGMTYSGAHNPPHDIFTVTVKKDWKTEDKWVMQEYKVRKLDPDEKYECREPA